MDERRQTRALFTAFLARFFENEMSEGSRDLRNSFMWIIAVLAVPGLLIPVWNIFDWHMLMFFSSYEGYRTAILSDKAIYLSIGMGGIMLLTAVVWQALLVDKRDAIVLGSFPVRGRVIVIARLAALAAYVGIVGGGMHVIAALAYGFILAGPFGFGELVFGVLGVFMSGTLASAFACFSIAAFQATLLALGGPRLFARVTAPAQALLAAAGLLLFLLSPMIGWAASDFAAGRDRSMWVLWMPPVWFLGIYEVILGTPQREMTAMAVRALSAAGISLGVLLAMYPLAYRRVAAAAMFGSPLGQRRPLATRVVARFVRAVPGPADLRGGLHFILLTLARVARQKLILATAAGAALALSVPFVLDWSRFTERPPVPAMSHISIPVAFVVFALVGLRVAYSLPSELPAAWIFSTAVRPYRIGLRAARAANFLATVIPAALAAAVYAWFWGPSIAWQSALTIAGAGIFTGELLLSGIEYVPFAHAYAPGRARLQSRWPLYLIAGNMLLQLPPYLTRQFLLMGAGWIPGVTLIAAAIGVRLLRGRQPEPADLIDAERDADETLALRLY